MAGTTEGLTGRGCQRSFGGLPLFLRTARLDDFDVLREDAGLAAMLGYEPPSPAAARKFLYQFHDQEKIAAAQQQQLELQRASIIPGESEALAGRAAVNRDLGGELGRRCADQKIATVDLDATIIESHKRQAQLTYQGTKGYQPQLALWAEMDVVLADQFRGGHTPAIQEPLAVARRAFETLPETVEEYYFRGDTACYENDLLDWLRDEQRPAGLQGTIGFAVTAPLMAPLKAEILELDENAWQFYREDEEAVLDCAVVPYYPEEKGDRYREPLRYVAMRVSKKQGELFADGAAAKYFAVATNLWDWEAPRLLAWHREKAGSIEALHDVLKAVLSASRRFGFARSPWSTGCPPTGPRQTAADVHANPCQKPQDDFGRPWRCSPLSRLNVSRPAGSPSEALQPLIFGLQSTNLFPD